MDREKGEKYHCASCGIHAPKQYAANRSIIATRLRIAEMKREASVPETTAERQTRYAARSVADKLGIKPGSAVRVVGRGDPELLAQVRATSRRTLVPAKRVADVVLFFPKTAHEITHTLRELKTQIASNGGIWVITGKKGRGEPYVPDQILIPAGLAAGLVDNKICSVSETASAMRFVLRRQDR